MVLWHDREYIGMEIVGNWYGMVWNGMEWFGIDLREGFL